MKVLRRRGPKRGPWYYPERKLYLVDKGVTETGTEVDTLKQHKNQLGPLVLADNDCLI